jgi:hypothetical protein
MNKTEKQIAKYQLQQEQKTLRELKQVYAQASKDLQKSINDLNLRTDMQNLQSIIYQVKYQEAMKKQIDGILDKLNKGSYQTINEYLQDAYHNGYIGNMYSLQKQGIPITVPIDQKKVLTALQTDSKLSSKYHSGDILKGRLAEDVKKLKVTIRAELSRGIANGETWQQVAYKIALGMNNPMSKALNMAMRIARTEGHRVNQQGFLDAGTEAKKKGADIVKQWDATLDSVTRPWHQEADGQIREWDDFFEVGGEKMKAPSIGGSARNVCNCRCQLLQRAKWALNEAELKTLQDRASFFGLDKSKSFDDFKQKYLKLPKNADTMKLKDTFDKPINGSDEHYQKCKAMFEKANVSYVPVKQHTKEMTDDEIIKALAGWDKTDGSCASVAFAYIGQKLGFDVRDFRGGKSMETFRDWNNLESFVKMEGMKVFRAKGACSLTVGNRLLKQVEEGKEYYLCVGKHASIVRKKDGVLQYLELQADLESGWGGWTNFDGNPRYTLNNRFGCTNTSNSWHEKLDFMIDLDDSEFNEDEIQSLLGFINTNKDDEKKGAGGNIR